MYKELQGVIECLENGIEKSIEEVRDAEVNGSLYIPIESLQKTIQTAIKKIKIFEEDQEEQAYSILPGRRNHE